MGGKSLLKPVCVYSIGLGNVQVVGFVKNISTVCLQKSVMYMVVNSDDQSSGLDDAVTLYSECIQIKPMQCMGDGENINATIRKCCGFSSTPP